MIKALLKSDAGAGTLLVLSAVVALVIANSPLAAAYEHLLESDLRLGIGPLALTKTVLHWINDGLMAVFFMVVGLEIKRELVVGELSDRRRAALPVFGALGGMIAPALVYLAVTAGDAAATPGWPIPTATDIAFALGVLALVRKHVAPGLRIFLLGLAIIDDLGAVILIALLFTSDISGQALTWAAACVAVLVALNRGGVRRLWPYMVVGFLLWLSVLKSGVHATLAGVVIGLCVPLGRGGSAAATDGNSPLHRLEHALQPWVAFAIMPLFALANAGASLEGFGLRTLAEPARGRARPRAAAGRRHLAQPLRRRHHHRHRVHDVAVHRLARLPGRRTGHGHAARRAGRLAAVGGAGMPVAARAASPGIGLSEAADGRRGQPAVADAAGISTEGAGAGAGAVGAGTTTVGLKSLAAPLKDGAGAGCGASSEGATRRAPLKRTR